MIQPPWRIVLFSNLGAFAERFEQVFDMFGHKLVGVVTSPGPANNRTTSYQDVVRAMRQGIDVVVSTHPKRIARMIEPMRPDLVFSIGFPYLIPDDVIMLPPLGAINVHAGSLPRYRGPHPVGWAFRNGDSELGLTVHRLDSQFDTGPVLATGAVPIGDDDTMSTLTDSYAALLFQLLGTAFQRLAAGEQGDPQDESFAGDAPFFEPEWRYINWSSSARTIHNQVRSWTGDRGIPKGAIGSIDGQNVLVGRTRLVDDPGHAAEPGQVLLRDDSVIRVQCGDGPIDIIEHEAGVG